MIELLERQKRLTANQWKLIVTGNLADLLDFFDFFLIGYVLAFITKEWQLTYWQGAVILLSSGIGAVPGAFFWGWVADKIGRRKVFIATALNVALATGIMYFTPGPNGWIAGWIFLSVMRFFVGVGNAGLYAVDLPLVQEFMPASKRGWVSALVTTLLPAGSLLGGVAGAYLAPIIGWRGRLPDRPDPDRGRRAGALGRNPVRDRAQGPSRQSRISDDLRQCGRDRWPVLHHGPDRTAWTSRRWYLVLCGGGGDDGTRRLST